MVKALKSTFITPIDREDLHRLVATFDNIIDGMELITLKISAYKIDKMDKHLKKQTEIFFQSFSLLNKLIMSIRKESDAEKFCQEIRKLEQAGDTVFIEALADLFSDSLKPQLIIKRKDLYSSLEDLIDEICEASLTIESIVVKYS